MGECLKKNIEVPIRHQKKFSPLVTFHRRTPPASGHFKVVSKVSAYGRFDYNKYFGIEDKCNFFTEVRWHLYNAKIVVLKESRKTSYRRLHLRIYPYTRFTKTCSVDK